MDAAQTNGAKLKRSAVLGSRLNDSILCTGVLSTYLARSRKAWPGVVKCGVRRR